MSHTWAHKQFKKRYPALSRYVKVGEPINLSTLPYQVVQSKDETGVSYDVLEGRLQVLMSHSKKKGK